MPSARTTANLPSEEPMRAPFATLLVAAGLVALGCNNNTNAVGAPLPAPQDLASVSLNQAVDLYWSDNSYASAPSRFLWYHVYSTSYDLDRALCGTAWELEGATIAPEFLVGALTNGVPRCYGVTAVTKDGAESDKSLPWNSGAIVAPSSSHAVPQRALS